MDNMRMIELDEFTAEMVYSALALHGCLMRKELPEEVEDSVRHVLCVRGYLDPNDTTEPLEPPEILEDCT